MRQTNAAVPINLFIYFYGIGTPALPFGCFATLRSFSHCLQLIVAFSPPAANNSARLACLPQLRVCHGFWPTAQRLNENKNTPNQCSNTNKSIYETCMYWRLIIHSAITQKDILRISINISMIWYYLFFAYLLNLFYLYHSYFFEFGPNNSSN